MMRDLPPFIHDLIASPPAHGDGVHRWLYRVARHLHAHRSEADICELLKAVTADCGRPVPDREIRAAVRDSLKTAWQPGSDNHVPAQPANSWPKCDPSFRQKTINSVGYGLADLIENSPLSFEDEEAAEGVLPRLFRPTELICVGWEKTHAVTAELCELVGELATVQYVVPNPMSKREGLTQDGKRSVRCLDNTGPRRYLVVEFDSGSLDQQAALLFYLATLAPLLVCAFSGSKSLHGWFAAKAPPDLRQFFRAACLLGADPATWTKCQFVRMPGGLRAGGARQSVYWFQPPKEVSE